MRPVHDLRAHIEKHSIPEPMSGCWIWLRALDGDGYGVVGVGRWQRAHRASYRAFKGPIPTGVVIQHSCDTPCCVAPWHLSVGTIATNNLDMVRKGRSRGPTNISAQTVLDIRNASGSQESIARSFGISQSAVSRILRRESRRSVA